jgi:hypothetical protein
MKTIREQLNVTPKIQRRIAKYVCEKLQETMIDLGVEDKINKILDQYLNNTSDVDTIDFCLNYSLNFNSNNLKMWIKDFGRKK